MFKNYLRVAFRNLLKNKSYVIINTFGLGISLACCITAYILVAFNIEYDDFYEDEAVKNIYRIHAHVELSGGDKRQAVSAPLLVGPMAAKDFAGIKRFTRFAGSQGGGASVSYLDQDKSVNNAFSERVVYADSTFFDMFDIPLVAGSHVAFKDRNSVFIDQERATKYFGDDDPIGKVLTMNFARGVERKVIVKGVFDKIPVNSTLYLPFLMRFEHFEEMRAMDQPVWSDWNLPAILFEIEDPNQVENIGKLFSKYIPQRNEAFTEQKVEKYTLEPFKSEINRNDVTWTYLNTPIEIEPLLIFIVLASMILLIACFNLTNTSIALTGNRLKEIGVRKSLGAHKSQIISQFFLETILVIFLSLIVGYGLSKIIVPEFTTMWELPYGLEDLSGVNLVITLLILVFLAAMLAGIYPALFSSKFNAVTLLKGTIKVKGTNFLTRTLVSIQFAISIIVLVGGVIFIQNNKFQEAIDFGYDKEQILTIDIKSSSQYERMLAKAKTSPIIKSIGVTEHHIGWSTYNNPVTYENVDYDVRHLEFGENYFETMKFKFVKGKAIDYDNANEYAEAVVVTEQFVKTLGIQGDPINQYLVRGGQRKKIIGVIEDFVDNVYNSKDPEPFMFYATRPERWRQIVIRADESDLKEANAALEIFWKDLFPSNPYVSHFQEDVLLEGTKQLNGNLKKIFLFLTVLGGLLSASGIYSLASLNIAKRTKEIGIRKALGASVANVVLLLNREFVIILMVAGILGSLGGYYGTSWMLDLIYAYHIPMNIVPVLLSALGIIIIGLSTTSVTILRAAKTNPVDTLRDE
ncbi:MAG: ABC transporter permease [Reichenbachiella sp.]